jgi:2-keto-3-deoxy-L-rhamnonate aldolase RhmA
MEFRNPLRRKLAAGAITAGLWVTLEAPSITEIAATLGLDYVVVDAEHGHLDFKEILEHLRAARGSDLGVLVRVQEIEQGLIKRVLDLGAHGIMVPQVRNAEEVAQAVRFAKYPPDGVRGVGGERAVTWGLDLKGYTAVANGETMVVPIIETVEAGRAAEAILSVPGVDAIQFGPADYSASAGYLGQWEGPGVAEEILRIRSAAEAKGIPCGTMATSLDDLRMRREQGFRMLALGSDTSLLIRAIGDALRTYGS